MASDDDVAARPLSQRRDRVIDYATLRRLDLRLETVYEPFDRVAVATVRKRDGSGETVQVSDRDEDKAAQIAIARYVAEQTEG